VGNFAEDPKPASPKATITGYFSKLPSSTKNVNNSTSQASANTIVTSLKRKFEPQECNEEVRKLKKNKN